MKRIVLWVFVGLAAVAGWSEDGSQPDALGKPRAAPERGVKPNRAQTVAGLLRALRDRDEAVREKAAESLGTMEPAALEAVDPLIAALQDRAPGVRYRAVESLQRIGTKKARQAAERFRRSLGRRRNLRR